MFTQRFLISFAIEFGPISLFFAGVQWGNFFIGTGVLVGATAVALVTSLLCHNRIPLFSLISSAFVLCFGALTLVLHNPLWLVVEYTLYNAIYGMAILVSALAGRPLLKVFFHEMFHISDRAWRTLSMRWGIALLLLALSNEIVWRIFSEDTWVYYRFLTVVALCLVGLSQFFLTRRERHPDASSWGLRL